MPKKPTIKGIFVKSHINSLRGKKGQNAVSELERRFGRSISFKNSDNVLVSDEVKIIEICLDLLSDEQLTGDRRAYEAGRLHFQNFTTTPLAKIIFSIFKKNFKLIMLNSDKIAGHVFSGVKFSSVELSGNSVKVVMQNNDYPIDHFKGLFQEWMNYAGLTGSIEARISEDNAYEYIMIWN